jgi:putative transcriptional regulator
MKPLGRWMLVLVLAFGAPFAPAARAQSLDAPVLLAADPGISGPYDGTVLLVLPSGGDSHFGFVLNRPTATRVLEVFPDEPQAAKVVSPLFLGGPFLRETVFALVRSPQPPTENAEPVLPDLYMVHGHADAAQVAQRLPARARFYAGVVIWQRGELRSELESRAWVIAEPDVELVIGGSADSLWQRVLERVLTMVAMR